MPRGAPAGPSARDAIGAIRGPWGLTGSGEAWVQRAAAEAIASTRDEGKTGRALPEAGIPGGILMRAEDEAGALGRATDDALVVALVEPCVAPLRAANTSCVGPSTAKVESASLDALDADAVDSGAMA